MITTIAETINSSITTINTLDKMKMIRIVVDIHRVVKTIEVTIEVAIEVNTEVAIKEEVKEEETVITIEATEDVVNTNDDFNFNV